MGGNGSKEKQAPAQPPEPASYLVTSTGFEPVISAVKGRRPNR